jgi:metacaspase-1
MKKALLVGINKYVDPRMELRGCVNDANNMKDILINYYDFQPDQIKMLLDEHATKQNIMRSLYMMVTTSTPGDELAFFQSSHGSQIADIDGDEKDRLDEILCPHDMDWDSKTYIIDDELQEFFKLLPDGVSMTVILDSCHSGTATKKLSEKIPKFIFPPNFSIANQRKAKVHRIAQEVVNPLFTAFAACRAKQYSTEDYIYGSYNGAFTYYLCKMIREFGKKISKRTLLLQTKNILAIKKYKQVPQLECVSPLKKLPLFGVQL